MPYGSSVYGTDAYGEAASGAAPTAPSGMTATADNTTEITVQVSDESINEDEFRLYRSISAGVTTSDTLAGTVSTSDEGGTGGTVSFTDTGLDPDTTYYYAATAFDNGGGGESALSNEDSATTDPIGTVTTDLPDAQQPTLDNSVEDEIAVDIPDDTNYGDYRVQTRETGETAWDGTAVGFDEQVLASDSDTSGQVSTTVTGREDGEEYEVRVRTETEHVNGAWTTPVSIVTKFPAASGLSATTVSDTRNDLAWTDNSDNEDGFKVLRELKTGGTFMSPPVEIADLGPNTTTYSDTAVQPDRTYRYTIRAYTEDATADSNTDTATTTGPGLPTERAPPSGWYAEVDLPTGETIKPSIASEAKFLPVLKELPRCELPVPKSDRWEGTDLDEQPLRVWKDGYQLPIDEIRTTTREDGVDIIHGIGGTELDEYTDGVEYIDEESHVAAENFINNETTYTPNVDDPDSDTTDNVRFQEADLEGEYSSIIDSPSHPFGSTVPLELDAAGVIRQLPTGFFKEAEDSVTSGTGQFFADTEGNDGAWSGNSTERLKDNGDSIRFNFSTEHEVPSGNMQFKMVYYHTGTNPKLEIIFDGSVVDTISEGALSGGTDLFDSQTYTFNGVGSAVSSGNHHFKVEAKTDVSDGIYVDFGFSYDSRYSYDFDTTPSDEVVTGWQKYPSSQAITFDSVSSVEQVTGVKIETTEVNNETFDLLEVRNDAAGSYQSKADANTFDHDFASSGQIAQARITLGRYGSGPNSGQYGDHTQELDAHTLYADLDDTPTLLDKSYTGKKKDILNRIAESGDFIWEVRYDGGSYSVEWCQAGQRTTDRDLPFVEYSGRHTVEETYEKIIVFGASQRISEETFTSNASHGALVGLDEDWIVPASETVYDPGTGTEFTRRVDYNMDWQEGAIETVSGGAMSTSTQYSIDYRHKTRGEYQLPGTSNPRTAERQIAAASTDLECEQLAIGLVKELQDPLEEVTATITEADPEWPLVEALADADLPFTGPLEVRGIEDATAPVKVRLGTRKSIDEAVDELRDRIDAVATKL